jgi:O-antigen/teichoic acid export membrane protein
MRDELKITSTEADMTVTGELAESRPAERIGLGRALSRDAGATVLLRIGGMGLAAVGAIVVARALGAAGYGTYSWAYALVLSIAIPAALGADQLLTREAGVAVDRADWGRLRTLMRSVLGSVGLFSFGAAALGAVVVLVVDGGGADERGTALLVALPILVLAALTTVAQGALIGLGRTALGIAPGMLVRPATFLPLVVVAVTAGNLSASGAMALQLAAFACAAVLALALLRRALARGAGVVAAHPGRERVGTSPRAWMRVSVRMGAAATLLAVDAQVGLIVLGTVGQPAEAGFYAAAIQCTAPLSLVLLAGRMPLAPIVARLRATGEQERLQRGLKLATRGVAGASAAVALVLIVIPGSLLDLFGGEFSEASGALRVLAVAMLVNALAAFNGMVLIMSGYEREALRSAIVCVTLDVVVCLVLAPPLGELGVAIGALTSITTRNVVNSVMVRRLIGVDATVIGRMRAPRSAATRR